MQGGGQKRDEIPDDHGVASCKVLVPVSRSYHDRHFIFNDPAARPAVMGALWVMWGGGGALVVCMTRPLPS